MTFDITLAECAAFFLTTVVLVFAFWRDDAADDADDDPDIIDTWHCDDGKTDLPAERSGVRAASLDLEEWP